MKSYKVLLPFNTANDRLDLHATYSFGWYSPLHESLSYEQIIFLLAKWSVRILFMWIYWWQILPFFCLKMSFLYLHIWRVFSQDWHLLSLTLFNTEFHCLLHSLVSVEKLAVIWLLPLHTFFSWFLVLAVLLGSVRYGFLCIYPIWDSRCFLNLWANIFITFENPKP